MREPPVIQALPPAEIGTSSHRLTITLYAAATFLYWMALYLYIPTLPTYIQVKTGSLVLVGIVLSMYGLWQAIIRLPLGITADWLGQRKPFIIVGFALVGLGAWILGSAEGVTGLAVGRAITGLAAATWVPLIVAFSSLFPPREAVKATAMLTLVGSLGRVLATSVAGRLNELGGYSLAFYLAVGAAGLSILIFLPTREKPHSPQRPSVAGITNLISRRDVLLPSLLNAIIQYANYATVFGFLPILAKQLGASDVALSVLVSLNISVAMLGNFTATAIVNRTGARRLIYFSFVLLSCGIGGVALATWLPILFIFQFCIGLAVGIAYPVLMGISIQHVANDERTTAMGLHQAVYAIGMFTGPWVSGWLANAIGIRPTFGVTAFLCLTAGLLVNRRLAAVSLSASKPLN